jgi:hypothetical protein
VVTGEYKPSPLPPTPCWSGSDDERQCERGRQGKRKHVHQGRSSGVSERGEKRARRAPARREQALGTRPAWRASLPVQTGARICRQGAAVVRSPPDHGPAAR